MSSNDNPLPPSNTRRRRRESDRKYLILVLFTLVVVGGFLIAVIYGPEALLTALPCLLGGAALILLPWLLLTAMQNWRERLENKARNEAFEPSDDRKGDIP
ncbi:MAG: hypothetical protein GWP61_03680 [Chloroflexi bacterium]|jgi:protein-S-isoprenylcysteine O-methyltransferase Ste14|nr:hypothetical protein [Chloroflexota bacterium]